MRVPAVSEARIRTMTVASIEKVRALEVELLKLPQVEIATEHVLHAGMYARTICVPAGTVITGTTIVIPTTIILNGRATLYIGDETLELHGHNVLAASAGRKQALLAHEDTYVTMLFPSTATTVEEAEAQFTDEAHLLFSRLDGAQNSINITGE